MTNLMFTLFFTLTTNVFNYDAIDHGYDLFDVSSNHVGRIVLDGKTNDVILTTEKIGYYKVEWTTELKKTFKTNSFNEARNYEIYTSKFSEPFVFNRINWATNYNYNYIYTNSTTNGLGLGYTNFTKSGKK